MYDNMLVGYLAGPSGSSTINESFIDDFSSAILWLCLSLEDVISIMIP